MNEAQPPERVPPGGGEGAGRKPEGKRKPTSAAKARGKDGAESCKGPSARKTGKSGRTAAPGRRGSPEHRSPGPGREPLAVEQVCLGDIDATDTSCQWRFSGWSHQDLADSMGPRGQHQPIHLRGEKPPYTIVDGFRRYAAALELEWDTIDAFVHRSISDSQANHLAFSSNVARKNLSSLEKISAVYLAEHKRSLSRQVQAEVFGVSLRTIERWHRFCAFPEQIRKIVDCVEVTVAHAKHLAAFRVRNPEKWAKRIRAENLTASDLKKALMLDRGLKIVGRPQQLFTTRKNKLILRPATLSLDASRAVKEDFIEKLMKVIDVIKDSMGEEDDDLDVSGLEEE